MNKITFITIIVIICTISAFPAGSKETGEVTMKKTYSGMAAFGYDPFDTGVIESTSPRVIRTQEEYESFISMIPEFEMTPISPAPPSKDPLLQKPDIDFSTSMMLVIFSHDVNHFISLKIEKVEITGDKMIVTTWYETINPDALVSKIVDYGFYYAAVVESFDGEVVFQ